CEVFGFCVGYGFYKLVGEGGDAAHALHEVEDDALAGEDGGGVVADDGEGLALLDPDAVGDLGMADDFEAAERGGAAAGEGVEEGGNAAESGDDAGLFGDDGAGG